VRTCVQTCVRAKKSRGLEWGRWFRFSAGPGEVGRCSVGGVGEGGEGVDVVAEFCEGVNEDWGDLDGGSFYL